MKKTLAAVAAALALLAVRASAQPIVTMEQKWIEKTVSLSTCQVNAFTLDVGGFGSAGGAVFGSSYTQNGVDGTTFGNPVAVSSATRNVVLLDYTILEQGATAQMQIAQTVKLPAPKPVGVGGYAGLVSTATYRNPYPDTSLFTVPVVSTSSAVILPSGTLISHVAHAVVRNPVFLFTGLTRAATTTIIVNYGVPDQTQ